MDKTILRKPASFSKPSISDRKVSHFRQTPWSYREIKPKQANQRDSDAAQKPISDETNDEHLSLTPYSTDSCQRFSIDRRTSGGGICETISGRLSWDLGNGGGLSQQFSLIVSPVLRFCVAFLVALVRLVGLSFSLYDIAFRKVPIGTLRNETVTSITMNLALLGRWNEVFIALSFHPLLFPFVPHFVSQSTNSFRFVSQSTVSR